MLQSSASLVNQTHDSLRKPLGDVSLTLRDSLQNLNPSERGIGLSENYWRQHDIDCMTYVVGLATWLNRQTSMKANITISSINHLNAVILCSDWDSDPPRVVERDN